MIIASLVTFWVSSTLRLFVQTILTQPAGLSVTESQYPFRTVLKVDWSSGPVKKTQSTSPALALAMVLKRESMAKCDAQENFDTIDTGSSRGSQNWCR